jgi:hypothetical protein
MEQVSDTLQIESFSFEKYASHVGTYFSCGAFDLTVEQRRSSSKGFRVLRVVSSP